MRRLALGRRRRGFGLLDFMVGTMVFAGVITTFASLTRVKMLTLHEADARRAALARAEAEVDALRSGKELPAPKGQADTDGFRLNFPPPSTPEHQLGEGEGVGGTCSEKTESCTPTIIAYASMLLKSTFSTMPPRPCMLLM